MPSLITYTHLPDGRVSPIWQQTCLEEYPLPTTVGRHEIGKTPWQAMTGVVKQSVNGADKRIIAIPQIILVWLPAALNCRGVYAAHTHHTYVPLKRHIGSIALVVKPIRPYNTNGIWMLLDKVYDFGRFVHRIDVGAVYWLAAKQ